MRIVIAGDYPQTESTITGGVEAVVLTLARELQTDPALTVDVVTLDRRSREPYTIDREGGSIHFVPASRLPTFFPVFGQLLFFCILHNTQGKFFRLYF